MAELYDGVKSVPPKRLTQDFREFVKDYEIKGSFFYQTDLKNSKYFDNMEYKSIPQRFFKNIRYKIWLPDCLQPSQRHKRLTDKEIMELLFRMQITVTPARLPDDTRKCMFCQGKIPL